MSAHPFELEEPGQSKAAVLQELLEFGEKYPDPDTACDADERVTAWHMIASHPYFGDCYASGGSLIEAMLAKLDTA